jgi:uncharacterized membrane protein
VRAACIGRRYPLLRRRAATQIFAGGIMGLAILILGLVLFLANHLFVVFRGVRAAAIARLGRSIYYSLFGLVSLASLALIVWGFVQYRADEWVQVWLPPPYMRHVTVGLMLIVCVLAVASVVPSHIAARLRFPFTVAIMLWAFAHLLANGDLGSMLMFGTFLVYGVYTSVDQRRRKDVEVGPAPVGWTGDFAVVLVGIALYLALGFLFHPYVIGIQVFG